MVGPALIPLLLQAWPWLLSSTPLSPLPYRHSCPSTPLQEAPPAVDRTEACRHEDCDASSLPHKSGVGCLWRVGGWAGGWVGWSCR